ncbi:MAG TPA: hypothetical protein VNT55_07115 [Baekduia sp.]|nr:hypothetical protein [Baekduia sp.]
MRGSSVVKLRLLVAVGVAAGSLPAAAVASRSPTKSEAAAIKRVALDACEPSPVGKCKYHGARVSTRNRRYAWADVTTEGFSGVLLKRPTARSRRFKVVGTQGGGIGACSYWRARAPRDVLRDLRIFGVVDDSGATVNCGKA